MKMSLVCSVEIGENKKEEFFTKLKINLETRGNVFYLNFLHSVPIVLPNYQIPSHIKVE